MTDPEMDFDLPGPSADELEREAEQLLACERVLLPEYSVRTSDDELLRVSSALQRLGLVFLRPQGERPAQAIPRAVIERATELQLTAVQNRLGVTDLDEPSSESIEQVLAEMAVDIVENRRVTIESYALQKRAEMDEELARRGAAMKARIAHDVAESEAA
jgi:hypothetical protein